MSAAPTLRERWRWYRWCFFQYPIATLGTHDHRYAVSRWWADEPWPRFRQTGGWHYTPATIPKPEK